MGLESEGKDRKRHRRQPGHRQSHWPGTGLVVAFLASPRSIAISGEVIVASGGTGQAVYH